MTAAKMHKAYSKLDWKTLSKTNVVVYTTT